MENIKVIFLDLEGLLYRYALIHFQTLVDFSTTLRVKAVHEFSPELIPSGSMTEKMKAYIV